MLDSASGTVLSVPIVANVPAGTSELVMEVFTPNGQATGNFFFIGSNTAAETGPSYLSAADCGIATPDGHGDDRVPGYEHCVQRPGDLCDSDTNPVAVDYTDDPDSVANASPPETPTPTPTVTPPDGTPTPTPSASPSPVSKAINLSTRMRVQTGDRVGIGGFIITGSSPKDVIIRAIGPTPDP